MVSCGTDSRAGAVVFYARIFREAGMALDGAERSFEEHPEAARILEERFWEIFED